MKNVCKNCGKEYEFEPKQGTYKFQYCSVKCRDEYCKKDSESQFRICEHCGKEYWWDNSITSYEGSFLVDTKRFCSFECGKEFKYAKVRETTLKNHGAIGFADKDIKEKIDRVKIEKYGDKNYNNREQSKKTCLKRYGVESISQCEEFINNVKDTWKNKSTEELEKINNKRINSCVKHFGVEHPSQSEEIKQKTKETSLERYGTEFFAQSKEFRDKYKNTCLEKYGVEHATKSEEVRNKLKETFSNKSDDEWKDIVEKRKHTSFNKYGVEFPQKSDEVKDKIKNTNLERYGTPYAIRSKEVQSKLKVSNLEKYGVEYAIGSKEVQEKIRNTNMSKYGYNYPLEDQSNRKELEEKRKHTCLKKYGVKSPIQVERFKKKCIKTCLEKYGVMYNCLSDNCKNASINVISKHNLKFQKKLISEDISNELEFSVGSYSYDLKVHDILIELNPTITHFSSNIKINRFHPKVMDYHQNKTLFALEKGYRCIHVWDWDDEDKVIGLLKEKKTLYARKLIIKELSKKETDRFLYSYHLQNTCNGQSVRLGLYLENELIELMTFGKPRYNKKCEWELLRLCTKEGYKVVGGAERLFKYFINEYNPKSVISYCDNAKFTGEVYKRLNMQLKSFGRPSKHWFNLETGRHITDNLLRQRGFSQLHTDNSHLKGENNELLMLEAGYLEIFDCGQSTYVWKK